MECDFSGWATKAGLVCTDGRTIAPGAFKNQHQARVPLVWSHQRSGPEDVLGHAILEDRGSEGVYAYCFFNKTEKASTAKELVQHGDISSMSIWANQLVERSKRVLHGAIREVSLVLSGANPGALIENIQVAHGDDLEDLDEEAIIFTGLQFEHSDGEIVDLDDKGPDDKDKKDGDDPLETRLKNLEDLLAHDGDETVQDILDTMDDKQMKVLQFLLGTAAEEAEHSDDDDDPTDKDDKKGNEMKHNVFEDKDGKGSGPVLSHDDMKAIVETAERTGSLKHAVEEYALAHGINDIETLFPDAKAISDVPEWITRRVEWVGSFLADTRKSPFSKIKTLSADLTFEDARAKGYVKGTMKREEFFGVASRTTSPTTVYKKQAIDRDDVIDITDFDVIAWLKGEMRLMLDEEIARAALLGDGRDVAHEDKINEQNIRPISKDNELFTTTINVNVADANSSMIEVADSLTMNRHRLKGSGSPTFYTTDYWLARFLTTRDADGKRMWPNVTDLATELRVKSIVTVEVMMEDPSMIGILVNPVDYVMGATKGGEVNMFDDFDIDYNKQKYLIETRLCGALVKVKAAMVVRATAGANTLAAPTPPAFDGQQVTIIDTTGVVYKNAAGDTLTAVGGPYDVAPEEEYQVNASAAAGYYFGTSDDDSWTFTGVEA